MKETYTTHAPNSPVCDRCKRKSKGWFDSFPNCEATGKPPIWVTKTIEVKPHVSKSKVHVSKGGEFSNRMQREVSK